MLGSAISFSGYMLAMTVLVIWMVIRIWRRSPLLAILTFFVWPASIIALITNWGDEDADIRVPFALTLVAAVLMGFMAQRTVEKGVQEMALALTEEEIELIREDDPELAEELEQARAEAIAAGVELEGGGDWEEAADAGAGSPASRVAADSPTESQDEGQAHVAVKRDAAELEAERRMLLEQAASGLSWRFGKLDLAPAAAELQLPEHFRFAPSATLLQVARLRGAPLQPDVLGWIVHRDVDMAREDAWYVQVRFRPLDAAIAVPPMPLSDAAEVAAQQSAFVARIAAAIDPQPAVPPQAPAWDAANAIATWRRSDAHQPDEGDHVAARLLANGVLEFVVPDLHVAHAELGERSVRLMALRTRLGRQARSGP
jgi:hypothetical protein